jgi:hypothetical protein
MNAKRKADVKLPFGRAYIFIFLLVVAVPVFDIIGLRATPNMIGIERISMSALVSLFVLPLILLGYYSLKGYNLFSLRWLSIVLPLFGLYPFAYTTIFPLSVLLLGAMYGGMVIPFYTSKRLKSVSRWAIVVLSIASLLGSVFQAKLIVAGLLLIITTSYFLRDKIPLLYLVSYTTVWTLANVNTGIISTRAAISLPLGIIFGIAVFAMAHRVHQTLTELESSKAK